MTTETTENRIDWPCVAKTITTRMDGSWTDAGGGYEVVVQTVNSNGGHVMPTISADECKGAQAQKDNGGGTAFIRSFNFELYASPPEEVIDALCARRCREWIIY